MREELLTGPESPVVHTVEEACNDSDQSPSDACWYPENSESFCESLVSQESLFNQDLASHPLSFEAELLPPDHDEPEDSEKEDSGHCSSVCSSMFGASALYSGSSVTVPSSCVLIMTYKMKHNLTQEALADLLHLIKLHCPLPNQCPSSVYHFNKLFHDVQYPVDFHYFCSSCLHIVKPSKEVRVCGNPQCSKDLSTDDSVSSFIEVPVEYQLKILLERKYSMTYPSSLYIPECAGIVSS